MSNTKFRIWDEDNEVFDYIDLSEPFDITVKREYEEKSSFQILKFECTKCNRENRIQK